LQRCRRDARAAASRQRWDRPRQQSVNRSMDAASVANALIGRNAPFARSPAVGTEPGPKERIENAMSMHHVGAMNAAPAPVIALHCSGAGAGQWRQLGETLGSAYQVFAPEHYGCERTGPWTGEHAFMLADEAPQTIDLIDRIDRKVHLVGHS